MQRTSSSGTDLFEAIASEQRRLASRATTDLKRGFVEFPIHNADEVGQALFSNLSVGGFCTLLVTPRRGWEPTSDYFEATRDAARRGLKIERAFLLPARHLYRDPTLLEHLRLDSEAGIEVSVYYVGDMVNDMSIPNTAGLDFGIWDNQVACFNTVQQEGAYRGMASIRVSQQAQHLEAANALRLALIRGATRYTGEEVGQGALEEPMLVSAGLAHELAGVLCKGDKVDAEDCAWYHCAWQYLRILNMVSTPTWHQDFFLRELASAAPSAPTVLVSGTADYSMLAHVYWAIADRQAQVHVVDLCQTPLVLCQWYAKFVGRSVDVFSEDIMGYGIDESYDLITTDAFLTRFDPEQQAALVARWFALLRPGGRVVTTVRIEDAQSSSAIGATEDEAIAFSREAKRLGGLWEDFLPLSPEDLETMAFEYARHMTSNSVPSRADLARLFEDAGFVVDGLDERMVPGEMHKTLYAEVVLRRPQ